MAGLSKGMSIQDIANKHKVDIDTLKQELKKGIKVEREHTSDTKKAARIAMDHLSEDPKYYTKLDKIGLEEFEEIPDVEAVETVDVSKGFIDYNPQNLNVGEEIYYSFDGKSYHKGKVINRPSSAKPNVYTIKNTNGIPTVIIYGGDRTNVRLKKKSLNENQLNKDLVKEFMKHVMAELELDNLPPIKLSDNSQEAIDMRSWGGYQPSDKSIHIVIAKRHPADVFRTLAHELVHYKQDTEGRLKPGSGATGSKDENEANSRAAVIMRNFAQAKPNLFEHLINEGQFGNYLFGDKDSGAKIGWYDSEKEPDTSAEKALFDLLKKYTDSIYTEYTNINLDDLIPTLKELKNEYPEVLDPKLNDNAYIYRGTTLSPKELDKLELNTNTTYFEQGYIVPNQTYSSKRQLSSWSTDYYPAATFAVTTSDEKGGIPVVMRAKVSNADLYFNSEFLSKLSTQPEKEVFNITNPIPVDVMVINLNED
jgi:hypothetical protein